MSRNNDNKKKKRITIIGRFKQFILRGENEREDSEELKLRELISQLSWQWLLRQLPLMTSLFLFAFLSITARYAAQTKDVRINELESDIDDYRNRVLTRSSELTERKRQSKIEEALKAMGDSTLTATSEAPFLIPK
ncbi:MAG: hypothetical protein K2F69_00115 [Bacteroidaceae bacterium]|nr:hypothetical protein [Bacteroidaceae bacterium]MDE6158497.1 hypothetical protein [Bacteroidaceae bacterium]